MLIVIFQWSIESKLICRELNIYINSHGVFLLFGVCFAKETNSSKQHKAQILQIDKMKYFAFSHKTNVKLT